ncbi:glycosyltransferase [Candidatus Omnitrophota bacterium]
MKKVLFLYITEVSGHHSAVNAIEDAIKLFDPQIETKCINAFKYTNPIAEKLVHNIYLRVIKRRPHIWGNMYDNPRVFEKTQRIKKFIHRMNFKKIDNLIEQFEPDVIVCSQAYPCGMVADYKMTFGRTIPLFAVLTDFAGHSYWLYDGIDYFVVACEEAKKRFVKDGIPEEKISVFGIPIHPKFAISLNKEEIAKKIGVDASVPTILIMGGGHGLGPVEKIVQRLDAIEKDLQIIVITGINKSLLQWLNKRKEVFRKKVLAFEYVDNIDELMEIATVLISKPGGLTSSEALAKNLPLVIMNPIPGQEANNTKYLLEQKVAVSVHDERQVQHVIEELLDDPEQLQRMIAQAQRIRKPESAISIAKLILNSND